MKPIQIILLSIFLIGFSFISNANAIGDSEKDQENKFSIEEIPHIDQNFSEDPDNFHFEKKESSILEMDHSDVLDEIETPSEDSWSYFHENSISDIDDAPSKEESYDFN